VGGGQQGVEDDRFVAAVGEGGDDVRADEARATRDENAHAATIGAEAAAGSVGAAVATGS
jgi:hypothetical protein